MKQFFSRLALSVSCCFLSVAVETGISVAHAQDKAPLTSMLSSSPAKFEVLDLSKTSLRFADADASFYSASYQMDEQWKSFLQGSFAQQVLSAKLTQKYFDFAKEQWDGRIGPFGEVRRNFENPNIKSVIELLQDMVSEEIFIYGGAELPGSLVAITDLSNEIQAVAVGGPEAFNDYLFSLQKEDIDAIKVPTFVMGGKITNKDLALQQIDILEAILTLGLNQVPQLSSMQDALKRVEDDHGTRLTLTLQSSMIPWEQLAQNPNISEMVARFEALIEGRQFAISLGQFDEFFVVALGESADSLNALTSVSSSLLESAPMELVKSKSDQPIVAVNYASDAMAEANFQINLDRYFSKNVGQIISAAQMGVSQQINFTEDEDEIEKLESILDILDSIPEDLEWLDEQMEQHVPELKGQTSVAVARPDGIESWLQSRTESVLWDAQEELPILEHLGGNPIGFIAARVQSHPEYFATSRLIVRKVKTYLDRLVISEVLDESDAEKLDFVLQKGWPLLTELADVIEQDFIPSTEDGQFAIVLNESKILAKQWLKEMPPSQTDLPLLELAEIWGVNDSEKLQEGFGKLYDIFDKVVEVVREAEPDSVPPDYSVPRPETRENSAGVNYFYPIPDDCPVPKTMALQALFGEEFAYFNYSEPQMKILTKETELSVQSEFLDNEESLGTVIYIDFGRLFTQLKPWLNYGADLVPDEVLVPSQDGLPEVTKSEVLELLEAFEKCGEFVSVESGTENGSMAHGRYFRK